ncbi:hypothetical protein E4V51_30715 [Paenibacillus sp. 28ISP30-2]|nr:hypothetical protein [Paenibacillus sp. 28ISP30-2]
MVCSHQHGLSMGNFPPLETGYLFIQGHTHIPVANVEEGIFVLNPGSIALPKENYPTSYGIREGGQVTVKGFDGDRKGSEEKTSEL